MRFNLFKSCGGEGMWRGRSVLRSQLPAALLCYDLVFTLVCLLAIHKGSCKLGVASRFD